MAFFIYYICQKRFIFIRKNSNMSKERLSVEKYKAMADPKLAESFAVTPQDRQDFNRFTSETVRKLYPKGVPDDGIDPTPLLVDAHRKAYPDSRISTANIKQFQEDLQKYNQKWLQLQPNIKNGEILSKPSPIDGRVGSITGSIQYPEVSGHGTDIDAALSAYEQSKLNEPYIDPSMTNEQRREANRDRAKKGLKPMTIAEYQQLQSEPIDPSKYKIVSQ